MISARLKFLCISTGHFKGQGWAKGETAKTNAALAALNRSAKRSNDQVFIENSPEFIGSRLTKRLLALGWKYECTECGISAWRGKPLSLQLDHINGVNNDNRQENLRFLCPNCHSQTSTYCRSNRLLPRITLCDNSIPVANVAELVYAAVLGTVAQKA